MRPSTPNPGIRLSEDQERKLDQLILANRILQGLALLRELSDLSLHQALDAFCDRFEVLKACSPDAFSVDLDHYWDGFYS